MLAVKRAADPPAGQAVAAEDENAERHQYMVGPISSGCRGERRTALSVSGNPRGTTQAEAVCWQTSPLSKDHANTNLSENLMKLDRAKIVSQIKANIVAIASIIVALTGMGYNTWRNEKTEINHNVRAATFETLKNLG